MTVLEPVVKREKMDPTEEKTEPASLIKWQLQNSSRSQMILNMHLIQEMSDKLIQQDQKWTTSLTFLLLLLRSPSSCHLLHDMLVY